MPISTTGARKVAVIRLRTLRSKDKLFSYLLPFGVTWIGGAKMAVGDERDGEINWRYTRISQHAVCLESNPDEGTLIIHHAPCSYYEGRQGDSPFEPEVNYDDVPHYDDVNSFINSGTMEKVMKEHAAPPKPELDALITFVGVAIKDCQELLDSLPYDLDEPVVLWKKKISRFIARARELGIAITKGKKPGTRRVFVPPTWIASEPLPATHTDRIHMSEGVRESYREMVQAMRDAAINP